MNGDLGQDGHDAGTSVVEGGDSQKAPLRPVQTMSVVSAKYCSPEKLFSQVVTLHMAHLGRVHQLLLLRDFNCQRRRMANANLFILLQSKDSRVLQGGKTGGGHVGLSQAGEKVGESTPGKPCCYPGKEHGTSGSSMMDYFIALNKSIFCKFF